MQDAILSIISSGKNKKMDLEKGPFFFYYNFISQRVLRRGTHG